VCIPLWAAKPQILSILAQLTHLPSGPAPISGSAAAAAALARESRCCAKKYGNRSEPKLSEQTLSFHHQAASASCSFFQLFRYSCHPRDGRRDGLMHAEPH
jgi:hypothetical protein